MPKLSSNRFRLFPRKERSESDVERLGKVMMLLRTGRLAGALARLDHFTATSLCYRQSTLLKINLLATYGRCEAAIALCGELLELNPDNQEGRSLRARLHFREGNYMAAWQIWEAMTTPLPPPVVLLLEASHERGSNAREPWLRALRSGEWSVCPVEKLLQDMPVAERGGMAMHVVLASVAAFMPHSVIEELVGRVAGVLPLADLMDWASIKGWHLPHQAFSRLDPAQVLAIGYAEGVCRRLEQLGRFEEAARFAEALPLDGNVSRDLLDLAARLHRKAGNVPEAIALYRRLVEVEPDNEEYLYRLHRLDARNEADENIPPACSPALIRHLLTLQAQLLAARPDDERLQFRHARTLAAAGAFQEAGQWLERLRAADPSDPVVSFELARNFTAQELHREAFKICRISLKAAFDPKLFALACQSLRYFSTAEAALAFVRRHHASAGKEALWQEVRMLFFHGRFPEAESLLATFCEHYPEDREARLLHAAAAFELGRNEQAGRLLQSMAGKGAFPARPEEFSLYLYKAAHRRGDIPAAMAHLNDIFTWHGMTPIRCQAKAGDAFFDSLFETTGGRELFPAVRSAGGPSVAVIMTAYDSEKFLEVSVRSILRQRYHNLALLIADDGSTDRTPEIIKALAGKHPQITAILQPGNAGTYVCKNVAIQQSTGDYIAFQDSDDWSHPDRLAMGVSILESCPHLQAVTSRWFRMNSDGDPVIRADGRIGYLSCISLIVRRSALETVGYFDSVRIGADTEFIDRLKTVFGRRAVLHLKMPLMFGRKREGSLTSLPATGVHRTSLSASRASYRVASSRFHAEIRQGCSPFVSFPLTERPFSVPREILP